MHPPEPPSQDGIPDWALDVTPGTFDPRVLHQDGIWITDDGDILHLTDATTEHLRNIRRVLEGLAPGLHHEAVLDTIAAAITGDLLGLPCGDRLTHELTGHTITETTPEQWLATTALVRAIARELRRRRDATA